MADEPTILYAAEGAVATVTINRPGRRNAMLSSMLGEMNAVLHRAANDPAVRVLILRGAGNDFCPGADLDANDDSPLTPEDFVVPVLLHEMPAVTIAAIQGACAGAGLRPALRRPLGALQHRLPRCRRGRRHGRPVEPVAHRGPAKARELYFLPGKFDGEEAARIGLVSRLFPDATFHDEIGAIRARLAAAPPLALKRMKAHFIEAERLSFRDFVALESRDHIEIFKTEDTREAFRAKVEKRAPNFKGR